MAPSLKISAGPSVSELKTVAVNHDLLPTEISTEHFQGRISVRIKDFSGEDPPGVEKKKEAEYFESGHGKGMSWSMQVQGRFLKEGGVNADDLVFGNEFDKSIKSHLPYGTSIALQFVKVIDPNLQHDLYGDKPWAFSPLVATMNRVQTAHIPSLEGSGNGFSGWPDFPTPEGDEAKEEEEAYVQDDVSSLFYEHGGGDKEGKLKNELEVDETTVSNLRFKLNPKAHDARKAWFGNKHQREKVVLGPKDVVTADFFNAFIDFNNLSLHIPFSGGLSFDLRKYWDGQPVRYVCKDNKSGTVFFVIQFDITDPDN
ncbi:DUF1769-domain-containing protein [Violaceomyces palustris]|uniref:DUF1769-domain-containing protein n=1 Tax=Violaceomyces palustris TaxID=1673888 RepID=A0ACD0NTD9_9BASI|nr:DUF1769-domain-containing protein [Violaceomyces palustris]